MKTTSTAAIEQYKTPVRNVGAKIYLNFANSTFEASWTHKDKIASITYERVGVDSKFYGFGVCQKANIKLVDKERTINLDTDDTLKLMFSAANVFMYFSPTLHITQTHRDEITNELSITAYDAIYDAAAHTVSELEITTPATINQYATAAAALLGLTLSVRHNATAFHTSYEKGANLDGTETIRELLDAIAEATQTIYYININNVLIFQALDKDAAAVYTIDKEQYYSLDSGANRRLAAICHTTELGDSLTAALEVSGTTQYVRDNPFYELREDAATLLDNALDYIGGLTINQFECEWRGNPALEICDKIALITKDDQIVNAYLLNDVITFDGSYSQSTKWHYEADTGETESNPTNLGEALNKTFARVDKVNKQIDIVASEAEANKNNIAALQLNTESITASVSKVEQSITTSIDGVNNEIATLTNKVEAAMTAEGVRLTVQEELANGVDRVYTSTGFAFDADGLRVSKTGSEMETLLDEDGLSVFRDNVEVLTADNTGVNGINMTVRQYLIVGGSRFEAYGAGRTGCFWIG